MDINDPFSILIPFLNIFVYHEMRTDKWITIQTSEMIRQGLKKVKKIPHLGGSGEGPNPKKTKHAFKIYFRPTFFYPF